jgi:Fe-S-cluster containining protein
MDLKSKITILPRLGISSFEMKNGPEIIIAFQLMGTRSDGNYCPFLDIFSESRSPHGGYICSIYNTRPLACQAYPVLKESKSTLLLDSSCAYSCKYGGTCSPKLMDGEIMALQEIKNAVRPGKYPNVWRYATHIGEKKFRDQFLPEGWYIEP